MTTTTTTAMTEPGEGTPATAAIAAAAPTGKGHIPSLHSARQIVVPSCNLDLAVQHQFKDATLFVWVDGKLALTRPLHGGTQKRMVVFSGIHGVDSETLKIPAGNMCCASEPYRPMKPSTSRKRFPPSSSAAATSPCKSPSISATR